MTGGQSSIDYDGLTQQALRSVVRSVLVSVAKTGLPGDHHFFIAFDTRAPGVSLSRRLKEKYPEEMMIVLQHRFWDLIVSDDRFEVKLTFDGIPERLAIPFSALKLFFDPSVRFTLQFEDVGASEEAVEPGPVRTLRDVSDSESDAARPVRRTGDRRTGLKPVVSDASDERASPPAPATAPAPAPAPIVLAPRPVETSADADRPAAPAEAEPVAGAPDEASPSPAGAKVVSIDSWRNRK